MHKDFEDFVKLLNKNKVKYVIIGGYAVNMYYIPRNTKDFDVLIEPSLDNSVKMIKTINDFGFGGEGLTIHDFAQENIMVQIGNSPVRIDILTSAKGITWNEVWQNRVSSYLGKIKVNVIDIDNLIKNKSAVKRPTDLIDVQNLKKVRHLFNDKF